MQHYCASQNNLHVMPQQGSSPLVYSLRYRIQNIPNTLVGTLFNNFPETSVIVMSQMATLGIDKLIPFGVMVLRDASILVLDWSKFKRPVLCKPNPLLSQFSSFTFLQDNAPGTIALQAKIGSLDSNLVRFVVSLDQVELCVSSLVATLLDPELVSGIAGKAGTASSRRNTAFSIVQRHRCVVAVGTFQTPFSIPVFFLPEIVVPKELELKDVVA